MSNFESINLKSLLIFISVYELKNFSLVARREGISASQVSRVIHNLEDALGQQLFYRNTRAIIPTESGNLFIKHARAMTSNFHDARQELSERLLEPSGIARINAPVFFGQKHIAPGLSSLSERYPDLEIELTLTDDFIDPMKDASDIIFRIGTLTDSSYRARIIGEQTYHLAASPNYIENYGMPETPEDISQHKCLVYSGSSGPNRWHFRPPGSAWVHYPISPVLSSNSAESLLTAALNHMGIVLFPDWLMADRLLSGELVKLLPNIDSSIHTETQTIAAIYPNARRPSLNARAIIDHYIEVFGSPLYWQR
ncbi:LysR substrate-binding domain-containing protein [Rhodanobacter aciditrophus]|uniref:LysR substrate-binding domain-containing protein n=1 Tax=Rhodanobacter aciditrophus TaxID=1623218 RepID=A0ABW4B0J3_9GAMM